MRPQPPALTAALVLGAVDLRAGGWLMGASLSGGNMRQAVPRLVHLVLQDTAAPCPPEVVVVGGAIRIPRVQKVLQAFLEQHGAVMKKTLDIDRGLSLGAVPPSIASCLSCLFSSSVSLHLR